jgi:protein-tyrosine phosphatase
MGSEEPDAPPDFTILTVCAGNICRSPLAEVRLRSGLSHDPGFCVISAGLSAVVGEPMEPHAAAQLRAYGEDPSSPRGEQLGADHIFAADLVLAMTRSQRDAVAYAFPRAALRTFTLTEFERLSSHNEFDEAWGRSPRSALKWAVAHRELARLGEQDDVADPMGQGEEVHAAVARRIVECIDAIIPRIRRLP